MLNIRNEHKNKQKKITIQIFIKGYIVWAYVYV